MPTIKLTDKAVERIPFADTSTPVEYYDKNLTGFGVRAGLKSKTYFVKCRAGGDHQYKRKIGKVGLLSFDEAYKKASDVLKDADQGVSPDDRHEQEIQADLVTLKSALKMYFKTRKKLKPKTKTLYENSLNWYLPDWLEIPMRSITPAMVVAKHAEVGAKTKAQADGVFRVVRALFTFIIDSQEDGKEFITRNPVRRLSTLKAWYNVPRKKTFVKPSLLPVFFDCVNRYPGVVSDYMVTLLFTGIRSQSEIAKLEVSHVDFREQAFSLFDTKSEEWLYVPMCKSMEGVFKRRVDDAKEQGTPYLFYSFQAQTARRGRYVAKADGGYIKDVRGTIKKIFQGTEIADLNPRKPGHMVTPHDLRRTFLTYADELGISNVAQKRLVGHAIPTDVTDGYKELTMERLMTEVTKIETFILENKERKNPVAT